MYSQYPQSPRELLLQLALSGLLSTGYALVMMAVIVGTALQLGEDGVASPSAVFLIAMTGSFFIAACLHPQEFWCIVPGIIYLASFPSALLLSSKPCLIKFVCLDFRKCVTVTIVMTPASFCKEVDSSQCLRPWSLSQI